MTVNNDIDDDSATKHGDSHSGFDHSVLRQELPDKIENAPCLLTFQKR